MACKELREFGFGLVGDAGGHPFGARQFRERLRSGQRMAFAREDGASALRLDIAHGKAGAAIGMGTNSRALAVRAKDMPAFFSTIASNAQHPFIPQTGAVLITNANGEIIGAAGASGGTGDEDEEIVIAGIAAAGLRHL